MDSIEAQKNLFIVSDAKLHAAMCKQLSTILFKVLGIVPALEDARPENKSEIEALNSLHVAIDMSKNILRHCSECSKLYLAITADSTLVKFEKVRCALEESLRRVEDLVPQNIGFQIMEITGDLEVAIFTLDQSEKQVGDELIALLQKEKPFNSSNEHEELQVFHEAALKLGITSSRAAVTERRALKSLIKRACGEEDKRKESIIAYLMHLMRNYSKGLRNEVANDTDSQGSTSPHSPADLGSIEVGANGPIFERKISKLSSINFKYNHNHLESVNIPTPAEELRCPISLQLMYDPVIISSGQTYERACIEKWINDGHVICPKTRQQLPHLSLTPNYCVKGLIASWCEQNGVPIPSGPPESLDLNYWRLSLSVQKATYPRFIESSSLYPAKGVNLVPVEATCTVDKVKTDLATMDSCLDKDNDLDEVGRYVNLLAALSESETLEKQCRAVEQIRFLLKDDEVARIDMGADEFVEALVRFLRSAINEGDEHAQETGAMALFNLAVNINRNKEKLLAAGVLHLLEEMIENSNMYEAAAAVYLNLSCLDEAKPIIGSSQAVPFLIQLLQGSSCRRSCKHDALYALYNLSSHPGNISFLVSAGVINCFHSFITTSAGSAASMWIEKALVVLTNIAESPSGTKEIVSTPGLIGAIASILDSGEPSEQEQATSCFSLLCDNDNDCRHTVLQEGVIPALVCLSVNGTPGGRQKAHNLLKLFRELRQREQWPAQEQLHKVHQLAADAGGGPGGDGGGGDIIAMADDKYAKAIIKLRTRRLGKALNPLLKIKRSLRHFC